MQNSRLVQKYTVLKVLCSDNRINCYIAQRNEGERDKYVLINEICQREIINQYISQVITFPDCGLTDFVEYFTEDSKLYVVFCYTEGMNLKKVLTSQKLPFEFRALLGQKILHTLMENGSFPNVLKANVLQWENILFNDNVVGFNYRFFADEADKSQNSAVYNYFKIIMYQLFREEEIEKNPKLKIIVEKCEKDIYHSFGEVLKDLQDVLVSIDKDKDLKTIAEEKKKKLQAIFSKAMVVLVAVAVGIVTYERFLEDNKETTVYNEVDKIGTVDVIEKKELPISEDNVFIPANSEEETEEILPETSPEEKDEKESVKEAAESPKDDEEIEKPIEDSNNAAKEESQPQPEYKIHYVTNNENLTKIVRQEYGSDDMLKTVMEFNGITNGNIIRVGQQIKLPIIKEDE
ncbi:MAG: LysM peptidoglycan-binding domain-containing protein [Epulopiscium sp.]|nr:LysM peptidoglycan-binding domain-containing protein [Candidatus Epulonipiscium sp.]